MADLRIPSSVAPTAAAPVQGSAARDAQRAFFAAALKSQDAPAAQISAAPSPLARVAAAPNAAQPEDPSGQRFSRPGSRLDIRV